MAEEREKGLALFREIYGDEMTEGLIADMESSDAFGGEQSRWTIDWAFGSVWTREGLERKLRSCVVLGMLIGQGQSEEIKFHTRMGTANGLSRKALEEIFYTAIPYCGFPAANKAKTATLDAFEEMDAAGGT